MTVTNFQTGALSGVVCTVLAKDVSIGAPGPAAASGVPLAGIPLLLAVSYHVTAGAGLTAATITFQELGGDGTWRNLNNPTPLALTTAGETNNNFEGPFHGVRANITGVTGGSITFFEIQAPLVQ